MDTKVVGQTVFITKYALTSGILTAKVLDVSSTGVTVEWNGGMNGNHYFSNNVVFFYAEDAQLDVKKQAARKVKSLEKTLKQLSSVVLNGVSVKPQKES